MVSGQGGITPTMTQIKIKPGGFLIQLYITNKHTKKCKNYNLKQSKNSEAVEFQCSQPEMLGIQ